jgi:diguanylate cyclase
MSAAEWSGNTRSIGLWALREACNQARSWRDANLPPIRVAIRISTVELRSIRFVENVREVLHQTGVRSDCLEFGITEAALAADCPAIAAVLHALCEMGVQVALDGFGTGISSLTDLKRYPLCAVKIDESLVHGLRAGGPGDEMADALISAARSFRLRVIARGIEQREQLLALRRLRCDEGQGRYFHGPASANEFAGMLRSALVAA